MEIRHSGFKSKTILGPHHQSSYCTLTKSAVTIANSVCEPGNHTALMMKFPVANWGCNTK